LDKVNANRNYDCYSGKEVSFDFACNYILENSEDAEGDMPRVAVVSDRAVAGYYYNRFENQFILHDMKPSLVMINPQDTGKTLKSVSEITAHLTEFDFGSGDWIVALGGGSVHDCAGFAHSMYMEGTLNFLSVPTTLNAAADSAVSRNCYLNVGLHKSMLVAEFSPTAVLLDPEYLETVPSKFKSNGYAKIMRLAVLGDTSLLTELKAGPDMRVFLEHVYKVRSDIEKKNPLLLTLGSEIAGSLETYFRFMNFSEGDALALSIYAAAPKEARNALSSVYSDFNLPTVLSGVTGKMVMKTLTENIKAKGRRPLNVVDYETGRWVIKNLTAEEALKVFEERIKAIDLQQA